MSVSPALSHARANHKRIVSELQELVRFPSISAQPDHARDIQQCAAWLANHLKHIGLEHVQIRPTPRHPVVYAEWQHAPGRPTVLIYGHYDVQPVDPLSQWHAPPFDPVVKGDNLFGRGASDDKGQFYTHLKAIEAYLRTAGRLPVNVKCLLEGEEEIGSPNLPAFLKHNRDSLRADVAVISDTTILSPTRPAITYALRGDLKLELTVRGPRRDLHSGQFGGAVRNPAEALSGLIGRLYDASGRVRIPGFYNQLRPERGGERAYLARTGPNDAKMRLDAQVDTGWGEPGYSLYERTVLRPALIVNGLTAGYQGPGTKAVLPSQAMARLNIRLVPDQDPAEVDRRFRSYIARLTPAGVRSTVRTLGRSKPIEQDPRHPAMRAAASAYEKAFGRPPVFRRSGGTIPAVNLFKEILGIPTVLMGFALLDDHMHAPNEKFHLPNFYHGIATSIWFLHAAQALRQAPAVDRILAHDY